MKVRPGAREDPLDVPCLTWPGKPADEGVERLAAAAPEPVEVVGDGLDPAAGLLVEGDNAESMRALLGTHAGRVDLVYLDPPFATGADFLFAARGEVEERVAYRDAPAGGAYLSALLTRLRLARALLSDAGSLFLHCDWHASHWIRCLLDEVFGAACFKNEIVWRYRRWPAKTRAFQRMHDVLFWYGKAPGAAHAWTQLFEPLAASTLATWGTKRQVADFSTGRRRPSQTDEETKGAPMSDVWDIGIVAPIARERVGYPTQKPEALLRRVVEAASRPGDLVLDPFAGSGTTLVVAQKLGRRWIGCDASPLAVHTTRKRLLGAGARAFTIARAGAVADAPTPARIHATVERDPSGVPRTVELRDFALDRPAPAEVRVRGRTRAASWWDRVDYWAVGLERPAAPDAPAPPFTSTWRAFRESPTSRLPLQAALDDGAPAGARVVVQVVDAFGGESRVTVG